MISSNSTSKNLQTMNTKYNNDNKNFKVIGNAEANLKNIQTIIDVKEKNVKNHLSLMDKTRKFPYQKDSRITTDEMKKVKISSLGVLPSRNSEEISSLNVVMEGKPTKLNRPDSVIGRVQSANETKKPNTPLSKPNSPLSKPSSPLELGQSSSPVPPPSKPVIHGTVGTLKPIKFSERPQPQQKPKTFLKRKKAAIKLPDPGDDTDNIDNKIERDDSDLSSQASSTQTIRSVKELVEEAKTISKTSIPRHKSSSSSHSGLKSAKSSSSGKMDKKSSTPNLKTTTSSRSVDEIIASLKNESLNEITEADKKIQEIMERVLNKSTMSIVSLDLKVDEDQEEVTSHTLNSASVTTKDTPDINAEGSTTISPPPTAPEGSLSTLEGPVMPCPEIVISEVESLKSDQEDSSSDMKFIQEALDQIPVTEPTDCTETEQADEHVDDSLIDSMAGFLSDTEEGDVPLNKQHDQQTTSDHEQFLKDLNQSSVVTNEEIVHVHGQAFPSQQINIDTSDSLSEKQTSQPTESEQAPYYNEPSSQHGASIHHFCTSHGEFQVPELGAWKKYRFSDQLYERHVTPSMISVSNHSKLNIPTGEVSHCSTRSSDHSKNLPNTPVPSNLEIPSREDSGAIERRRELAAERIIEELKISQCSPNESSKKTDTDELKIEGAQVQISPDNSCLYWNPAPPKWNIAPDYVKHKLLPGYHGAMSSHQIETIQTINEESDEGDLENINDEEDIDEIEDQMLLQRVLNRRHGSLSELNFKNKTDFDNIAGKTANGVTSASTVSNTDVTSEISQSESSTKPAGDGKPSPKLSFTEMRQKFQMISVNPNTENEPTTQDKVLEAKDPDFEAVKSPRIRCHSAPGYLKHDFDETLYIEQDYSSIIQEIEMQRDQLRKLKLDFDLSENNSSYGTHSMSDYRTEILSTASLESYKELKASQNQANQFSEPKTKAEVELEAGRAYIKYPKKKFKAPVNMKRLEDIERFLRIAPRKLQRSESIKSLDKTNYKKLSKTSIVYQSMTNLQTFDSFLHKNKRNYKHEKNPRELTRCVWNAWFDEVYPPTPPASSLDEDSEPDNVESVHSDDERVASVASTVYSEEVEVKPVIYDDVDEMGIHLVEDEVEKITMQIEQAEEPSIFDICRKGVLLRKLGKIGPALESLNQAVQMEPNFANAYWHRHFIYLLLNKKSAALDDLNAVLKYNRTHVEAYKSRAAIFKSLGDVTMSIVNYSQAIKLNPKDHESYYRRAEMYEQRGEMLLAMEDYAMTTRLQPSQTDALLKHGLFYFNNQQWQSAANDFTELLRRDSSCADAWLYRGRAYLRMGVPDQALRDLSAALHMRPDDSHAYYWRACVLRKSHPKKALQDYSLSLMLDDSEDNCRSYMHRGILYNDMGDHENAIPDFEAVLKLNRESACAHVNLGLIYLLKMDNAGAAVKRFTAAIRADPTYVRALVCRAEAYTKLGEIREALTDFTRAIHLRPDVQHYYMYRGKLVLELGDLELAAFCVRHASEFNDGLGQSPTQQAIVQTFLKNYDKAIAALDGAVRVRPIAPLFTLLGKTQMKAKRWQPAIDSFTKGLDVVRPWLDDQSWPTEAAEMFFLLGMCHTEIRDFIGAHEAFNNAIKVNSKYAEAYYQRGLSKMRLNQSKGIQDFNKSLALDNSIFQAFLSRAAYFSLKKQYTKAILNTNEALKLQPNSVRAYLYRGALKYHIKAYDLAIRDLTQAIQLNNTCAWAYFNRAVCYQDSGRSRKALQDYGIVLMLGEHLRLKVLINRGLLYYSLQDYKNSLKDLLMAERHEPRNKRIHHTIGLCYHKVYRLRESVISFTRALDLDKYFYDALIGRGNAFMDFGHEVGLKYAKRDYQRVLHLNPTHLPAGVNLAYALQVSGHYQKAWYQFTATIQLNAGFKPALEGRAIVNLQVGRTFEAMQDINASLKVEQTAELYTNRGVIHQFMNDKVNAMRDFQKAIQVDVKYSLAYFNAANVYLNMRQFQQALAYYNKAIIFNNKDESAFTNRAITKVLLNDFTGALDDFKRALELSPHFSHIYFNRANLHLTLKQYENARDDYTKALELQPDDPLILKRRSHVYGLLEQQENSLNDLKRAVLVETMVH